MRRRTILAATAAALTMTAGLAAPAAAQLPGQNGGVSGRDEIGHPSLPCVTGILEDPGPLSVFGRGGTAWSPDGALVAVEGQAAPDVDPTRLLVVDPDDCSWTGLGETDGLGVSWSPSGEEVAAVRDGDVVVLDAQTGDTVRQVTATPGVTERDPSWAPDGSSIAFTGDGGVRVAAADGSATPDGTLLLPGASSPDHSPDGTRIVHVTDLATSGPPEARRLAHADATDGSDVVVLPDSVAGYEVVWSPDGELFRVAGFLRTGSSPYYDVDYRCFTVTLAGDFVDGGGGAFPCSDPAWQPLPSTGSDPVDLTAAYLYAKVDPALAPSWGNSGPQQLIEVREGHAWFRDLAVEDLPDGVCGPGWAVQVDHVVGLTPEELPTVIDREAGVEMGWGTTVVAARHHSLGYFLEVPACA
ncbi:hypothetical protein [Actinotalea sp. C106]|uniref:hypothetical protein n=1 Tax=Actinotalea sp. C106 TaxID=2908644 RepID=UPI00202774A5|nr:hypothetical protein [Actinotalea sp. C106]